MQIGRNAIYNAAGTAAGMLTLLATTPFYLNRLGVDQFGILTLIASLTAPLGVINAGIMQSATKFVAEHLAAREIDKAVRAVRTAGIYNLAVGLLGLAALYTLASPLASLVFKIPDQLDLTATRAFQIGGGIWFAQQLAGTYQAVVAGVQNYRLIARHAALQPLLTYGGGALAVLYAPSVTSVLIVSASVSCFYAFYWFAKAEAALGGACCLPRWCADSFKDTWAFSSWQMLNSAVALAANHADRILLGTLSGSGLVGVYGVAISVQNRLAGLAWSATAVLFPAVSAAGSRCAAAEILLNYGRIFSVLVAVLYGSLYVLANPLFTLWVGEAVAGQAAPVFRVLMIVAFLGIPSSLVYQYLLGNGLTKWLSAGSFCTSIVTTLGAWILIGRFGLYGAAWSGAIGLLLTRPPFHWWVFQKEGIPKSEIRKRLAALYSTQASGFIAILVASHIGAFLETRLTSHALFLALMTPLAPAVILGMVLAIEAALFRSPISLAPLLILLPKSVAHRRQPNAGAAERCHSKP